MNADDVRSYRTRRIDVDALECAQNLDRQLALVDARATKAIAPYLE